MYPIETLGRAARNAAVAQLRGAVETYIGSLDLTDEHRIVLPGILSLDCVDHEEQSGSIGLHYRLTVFASVQRSSTQHVCWPMALVLPAAERPLGAAMSLDDLELVCNYSSEITREWERMLADECARATAGAKLLAVAASAASAEAP